MFPYDLLVKKMGGEGTHLSDSGRHFRQTILAFHLLSNHFTLSFPYILVEKMGGEGTPWSDSGRHGLRAATHRQVNEGVAFVLSVIFF